MTGPCKNSSCKSFGRPHPNCQCYGDMAKGGEAAHYCSKNQPHEHGCEYFADGGTVENPLHPDSHHAVAAFLTNEGLHGLIKMGDKVSPDALERYNKSIKKGHKYFDDKIEHLFKGGPIENPDHTKSKKDIHDWIAKGGTTHEMQEEIYNQNNPQDFAEGGHVEQKPSKMLHDHPVAQVYPEQNMMLQTAKGRMSNYLNTLKPQENGPRLAFDHKPDDRAQKKSYEKALHIAAHPLSILEKMQKGTILPEDIGHLKNLHPEVDEVMQKKLTERVVKDQIDGKSPSYKVRQGLSMLLGAPLSSDMTQPNLMAIQATFQSKKPQQDVPPVKNKRGSSSLTKVDDAYLTGNQARIARQQKT